MSTLGIFDDLQYYEDLESDDCPMDAFTAASLGVISFFLNYCDREHLHSTISAANKSGWTPIMYACSKGHHVLVYHLIHLKASRKCKSKSGETPLMLAISSGDYSTVETIFDKTDLEEKDNKQWTPLFYAVSFNRQTCLELLLKNGANANLIDFQNETPLMIAIKNGNEMIVEMLVNSLQKSNILPSNKESTLMLAKLSGNPKIQKVVADFCEISNIQNISYLANTKTTPKNKFLSPNRFTMIQYSPSPSLRNLKKRSLFNMKISKSATYSPLHNMKSPSRSCPSPNGTLNASPDVKFSSPAKEPYYSKNDFYCDVEKFLKMLGLERYWPIFRDEEVDFETLLTLTEENLKEVGITKYGPRRKIYVAIQEYKKNYL